MLSWGDLGADMLSWGDESKSVVVRFDWDGSTAVGPISRKRWHEIRWLPPAFAALHPYGARNAFAGLWANFHFPECSACGDKVTAQADVRRRCQRALQFGVPAEGAPPICGAPICPSCDESERASASAGAPARRLACSACCSAEPRVVGEACRERMATPYGTHYIAEHGPTLTANGAVGACSRCGTPCPFPSLVGAAFRACNRSVLVRAKGSDAGPEGVTYPCGAPYCEECAATLPADKAQVLPHSCLACRGLPLARTGEPCMEGVPAPSRRAGAAAPAPRARSVGGRDSPKR
eukprot:gene10024-6995_t